MILNFTTIIHDPSTQPHFVFLLLGLNVALTFTWDVTSQMCLSVTVHGTYLTCCHTDMP